MDDSTKRDYPAEPTIVGGRPLGNGRPQRGIPRGIEVLVKKASVDPAFREILLEKRASAASEIGLELSAAEIATLNAVPRAQIEQIIDNTTVPDEHRRVFIGKIATAMLGLLGVSVGLAGCYPHMGGIRPGDMKDGGPAALPPIDPKSSGPASNDASGVDAEKDRFKGNALDKESH